MNDPAEQFLEFLEKTGYLRGREDESITAIVEQDKHVSEMPKKVLLPIRSESKTAGNGHHVDRKASSCRT